MDNIYENKYIVISGGELFNKGAQAMSFISAAEMDKRFPGAKIVLLSGGDAERTEEEKSIYKMDILPPPRIRDAIYLAFGVQKMHDPRRDICDKYKNILKNTVAWLDISGYGLGSNWGERAALGYIMRIFLAKHYNIPIYLMPQSFGPFDFKGKLAGTVNLILRRYLPYCKYIMAREDAGKHLLESKYKLKNVIKTSDLVLQSKVKDFDAVYHTVPPVYDVQIPDNSVAIIPNMKTAKYGSEQALIEVYKKSVDMLLEKGADVFFIYHAVEDLNMARKIKNTYYSANDRVHVIEKELSCIDFGAMVHKFRFVIASRYHAIVHAYKEAVPAVVFGWAVKYRELMRAFHQEKYCFDVRERLDAEIILDVISEMCDKHGEESLKIATGIKKIQESNVYDLIEI